MKKTLILKFRISGNLRFLSHQETLTMLQRAMVRGRIELCYSAGFNPRPRASLPLPRSVGLASDDELLYASVFSEHRAEILKERLSRQLPHGCEIISIELAKEKTTYLIQAVP